MRQALRTLLAPIAQRRFGGVTLLQIDRWTLAEELWSFGEDALWPEALRLSDADYVRLWLAAGRLIEKDEVRSSGEAAALAAVAVLEGKQRPLARTRRRRQADRPAFERTPEERYAEMARIAESDSFPEQWR
jgi:hypothetical protein